MIQRHFRPRKKQDPMLQLRFRKFTLACHCHLEGHPLWVTHKQDLGRGFSLYYPRLLYFSDQMLVVMLFSQHCVLLSEIITPRALCDVQCMVNAIRTWFAVCLKTLHSQFGEEARSDLCINKCNLPRPVRR